MRCFLIVLLATLLLNAAHGYAVHYTPNIIRSFGDDVDNVKSVHPMRLMRDMQLSDQRQDYFSSPPDEQEMVLKGVEDGGQAAPATGGGWGMPSMGTVKGWASSAYANMPTKDAVAGYVQTAKGYLPESVQAYIPSESVIKNYLPNMETVAANVMPASAKAIVNPKQAVTQKLLGGTGLDKMLTAEQSDKLVSAMSDQILNKKEGANMNDIVNGMGQAMAQKAVENATPLMIRLVVHKVVYGMAVSTVGFYVASLAGNQIAQVSDAIADRAISQYMNYNGPYKLDLMAYLSKMNYADIVKNMFAKKQ